MKLLLDQNLSRRLLADLEACFPGSSQVALLGLDTATDQTIWDFAQAQGFCIVTKDADFVELALVHGFPPKILHLNLGNSSNTRIKEVLLGHAAEIAVFLLEANEGVLEID